MGDILDPRSHDFNTLSCKVKGFTFDVASSADSNSSARVEKPSARVEKAAVYRSASTALR